MTLTRPQEDIALIESFRKGNTSDLDKFYLAHRAAFAKWAENNFSLSAAEATDVYQDAVIVLYKNLVAEKLDQNGASLKTYLFGIGRNLALKYIRKRDVEKTAGIEAGNDSEADELPELTTQQRVAMTVFEKLADPCKSILRLYYYDKLSLREIAAVLNYSSEDVAKNQKSRCLKTVREAIFTQMKR